MSNFICAICASFLALLVGGKPAHAEPLRIYIDADFSVTNTVGTAIELGLRSALSEVDNKVAGETIEVVTLDHRSNPRRSRANLDRFQRDPSGIAVFGGKQSPPYLTFGEQINAAGTPLLLPWSAAGPVTRLSEGAGNSIFRLSVDDTKAGPFLVDEAIASGCERIGLVLIDTGWGRANLKTISAALAMKGREPVEIVMAATDVGPVAANNIARDFARSNVQCAIAVLSAGTSITVFSALHDLVPGLQVLSHWGLVSWEFAEGVPLEKRDALNLRILQTCGLAVEREGSPILDRALASARRFQPEVAALRDIGAPAGFVHAYDLGLLFRAAATQAASTPEWSQGSQGRRQALRNALEAIEQPVPGILRTYDRPFAPVDQANLNGHEALGQSDLCLVRYDGDNKLVAASSNAEGDVSN